VDSALARERLRTTFALRDFGIAIMRQNLRRRMPGASEEEVAAALRRWLQDDAPLPGTRPR